jgi:hypothetical protein
VFAAGQVPAGLAVRILWRMRLLALGDRNPDFLTHREIDSTLIIWFRAVPCSPLI